MAGAGRACGSLVAVVAMQAAAIGVAPIKDAYVRARARSKFHCRGRIVPDPVIVCRTRRGWQVARAWRMLRLFAA